MLSSCSFVHISFLEQGPFSHLFFFVPNAKYWIFIFKLCFYLFKVRTSYLNQGLFLNLDLFIAKFIFFFQWSINYRKRKTKKIKFLNHFQNIKVELSNFFPTNIFVFLVFCLRNFQWCKNKFLWIVKILILEWKKNLL